MTEWTIRLAAAAESDYQNILQWTERQFGKAQVRIYANTITAAVEALAAGPNVARARPRDEILPGLFSLHVARDGRQGRHLILFRVDRQCQSIEILRLLHDSMDLARHIPMEPAGN